MEKNTQKKPVSNFKQRIITSVFIVLALVAVILLRELTPYVFDAFVITLIVFSVLEVVKTKQYKNISLTVLFVFAGGLYALFLAMYGQPLLIHLAVYVAFTLVMILFISFKEGGNKKLAKECVLQKKSFKTEVNNIIKSYLFVFFYPIALLFTFIILNHIGNFSIMAAEGNQALSDLAISVSTTIGLLGILLVFAISTFTDVFAYAVGITLKGPKLCPKISPKKTISGSLGGLFGGVIASLLMLAIFVGQNDINNYLLEVLGSNTMIVVMFSIIGLVGSAVNQIGDLFASAIKRKHGVKDFGNIFPGHGGMLDRIDGIIFNTVFITLSMLIIFV